MGDVGEAVASGVKAGATGAAVAGTAAAIGAAAGASLGPFAVIAAPVGAAIGALIGFFVVLGKEKKPSPEELARIAAKHEDLVSHASKVGPAIGHSVEIVHRLVSKAGPMGLALVQDDIDILKRVAADNPSYRPIIDGFFDGLLKIVNEPSTAKRKKYVEDLKVTVAFFKGIAALKGNIQSDPFAYLRPPLSAVMGPALKAAGLDIADPNIIEAMRGNYDGVAVETAKPRRIIGGSPIRRKSVGEASGGRMAIDRRAFAPKIAPYGVGSFAMFPQSAPDQSWAGNNQSGFPLQAPWPYGLDADRFAKAKPRTVSPKVKVAAAGGAAALGIYLLFFL